MWSAHALAGDLVTNIIGAANGHGGPQRLIEFSTRSEFTKIHPDRVG